MTNKRPKKYPWYVTAYFGEEAVPPKQPGELAEATKHETEEDAIACQNQLRSRFDIGAVYKDYVP